MFLTTLAMTAAASGYAGGVWNPEDMVRLPGSSWALVSAMRDKAHRGALRLVDLAHPARAATALPAPGRDAQTFAPHGLSARAIGPHRVVVFVVDHGGGEAVDRFTLNTRGRPRIVAQARIAMPAGTSGNGVAALPDGGFVVASAVDPRDPTTLARFARAQPTGRVWRWSAASGWRALGPALSGANGIAASADGRTIHVSEWAARRVWRLRVDGRGAVSVPVPFLPDNLHWDGRTLLLAGQIGRPEQLYACAMRGTCRPMGYAVVSVEPQTLRTKPLLRVTAPAATRAAFGGVSGAVRTGRMLWLTTFMGNRIAYWMVQRPY